MKAYERQALLDRVERDSATIGATIPGRLEIEDESIALRERILHLQRVADLTAEQEQERERLLIALRRRRKALRDELESGDIDRERGETIATHIVDIDRARAALRAIGKETDIEEEIRKQRVADADRWRAFIKKTRRGIDRSLDR